jgi:hypothetical protein
VVFEEQEKRRSESLFYASNRCLSACVCKPSER